jgi:hypothetical protein
LFVIVARVFLAVECLADSLSGLIAEVDAICAGGGFFDGHRRGDPPSLLFVKVMHRSTVIGTKYALKRFSEEKFLTVG